MEHAYIGLEREVPVIDNVDVLVAGGGPAGVAAALAAARSGARVFLAEAGGCFGGLGTLGLVPAFMSFTDGVNFLAGGIGYEIREGLSAMREDDGTSKDDIPVELLKRLYDRLMTEQAEIDFRFESKLIAIKKNSGVVTHAVFSGKTDLFAVGAKAFVDATGDALLCHLAGAPSEKGDADGNMMAATLCSLWASIDWKRRVDRHDARALEQAFADGVFSVLDYHLPGMWRVGRTLGGGNIGHVYDVDGTDEVSLTRALVAGRKLVPEYERYYKEYLTGFENMELTATAPMMGVRETRRIVGDYVLDLDDFVARAVFEDEIGRYSYPVDIHASNSDKESFDKFHHEITTLRYKDGENYGIPYRCLLPKGLRNVLTAGRCVSTDRYMQSSIRVMPGCYITGQAAGVAAAMAPGGDVRAVDIGALQRKLADMGAFLPNLD